jgi:hypothetical protein
MDSRVNQPGSKDKEEPRKISPFEVARAISTIIVFGIPLVVGTAAIAGYGVYAAFKRLKK